MTTRLRHVTASMAVGDTSTDYRGVTVRKWAFRDTTTAAGRTPILWRHRGSPVGHVDSLKHDINGAPTFEISVDLDALNSVAPFGLRGLSGSQWERLLTVSPGVRLNDDSLNALTPSTTLRELSLTATATAAFKKSRLSHIGDELLPDRPDRQPSRSSSSSGHHGLSADQQQRLAQHMSRHGVTLDHAGMPILHCATCGTAHSITTICAYGDDLGGSGVVESIGGRLRRQLTTA